VRREVRFDPVSLASGVVIAALGALLLIDSAGGLHVSLGWMAVVLTAAVGAIFMLSGLLRANGGKNSEGD
jgi:hypothetical protein